VDQLRALTPRPDPYLAQGGDHHDGPGQAEISQRAADAVPDTLGGRGPRGRDVPRRGRRGVVRHFPRHAPRALRPAQPRRRRAADARLLATVAEADGRERTQRIGRSADRLTAAIYEELAMTDFRLLIDGRLVKGAGTLDVINPATGRSLTVAPRADPT